MSDFKEYSAAFHAQNDDIMHYGVKGMKWKHHKLQAGGVPGLVGRLIRAGSRTSKNNEEEQKPNRGQYADSDRAKAAAAEHNKTVEQNRSNLNKMVSDIRNRHAETAQKKEAFEKAARQGAQNDRNKEYRSAMEKEQRRASFEKSARQGVRDDRANRKRANDQLLVKEDKKRRRKVQNLRKAEQAYRRGSN